MVYDSRQAYEQVAEVPKGESQMTRKHIAFLSAVAACVARGFVLEAGSPAAATRAARAERERAAQAERELVSEEQNETEKDALLPHYPPGTNVEEEDEIRAWTIQQVMEDRNEAAKGSSGTRTLTRQDSA